MKEGNSELEEEKEKQEIQLRSEEPVPRREQNFFLHAVPKAMRA